MKLRQPFYDVDFYELSFMIFMFSKKTLKQHLTIMKSTFSIMKNTKICFEILKKKVEFKNLKCCFQNFFLEITIKFYEFKNERF